MLFRKTRIFLLDLDTAADPRVVQFLELGLINGTFIVPDPPETAEADHRTRRVKENVAALRKMKGITVKADKKMLDRDALPAALRKHKATLLTLSAELKTTCNGLPVIVLSEIHNIFKPQYLPGTELRVKIAKKGKEKDEGIAYLDGGIKVVIENTADIVGRDIEVIVQGTLDTSMGRVVFARPRFVEVN